MKKVLVMLLTLSMIFSILTGCSQSSISSMNNVSKEGKNMETKADKDTATDTESDPVKGGKKKLDINKREDNTETDKGDTKSFNDRAVIMLGLLDDNAKNVMISPVSIEMALAMADNGIDEEGKTTLAKYFGESIPELNSRLKEQLGKVNPDILSIANSVWVKEEYKDDLNKDYASTLKNFYEAEINSFNTSVSEVNKWVSDKTNGMIPTILDEITPDLRLMLINAMYFNGKWSDEFDSTYTNKEDFTLKDGTTVKCEMMSGYGDSYMETDQAIAFSRDYVGGYSFVGILPKEDSLFDMQKLLNSKTSEYEVIVKIPKFESSYSASLTNILSGLGIDNILRDGAMTGVIDNGEKLGISDIIHKTAIRMSEEGTEASAVTGVMVGATSAEVEQKEVKEVYLDRPFMYAIMDDSSNEVLFIGTMNNPNG